MIHEHWSGAIPADDQVGDYPGPAGLVRGAEARARVAVEVLVERDQPVPGRILVEQPVADRTPAACRPRGAGRSRSAAPASSSATRSRFIVWTAAGRALHLERVPEVAVVDAERLDQQVVDREPHGTAPVGVAAEQVARRLGGLVVERAVTPSRSDVERVLAMMPADSARRPWSDRNSSGSSIGARIRASLVWSTIDSIRQPACAGDAMCWTTSRPSRRLRHEPLQARHEVRQAGHRLRPERRHRRERQQPDDRAGAQRELARRRRAARRSRSRPARPTDPCRSSPRRSARSARRTSSRGPRRSGRARRGRAPARAGSGSTSPSTPSRRIAPARPRRAASSDRTGRCCRGPRKPPSNRLLPWESLRFTHQVKLSSSLWNTRSRKSIVAVAGDLVDPQRRPRVHRRVDVAEGPLVRRQLSVGVHVPLAAQQDQLRLRELRVDVRQRDAVKGEVPRGVPRVLPLVRHRDDVACC